MIARSHPPKQPPVPKKALADPDTRRCPTCGRRTAPFDVQRSALIDRLVLLLDVASEGHDADARQLLIAIAHDAKELAEEVAHPDKWSQGQPASELAHELSLLINTMREGATA
jgi:hypothetical protein